MAVTIDTRFGTPKDWQRQLEDQQRQYNGGKTEDEVWQGIIAGQKKGGGGMGGGGDPVGRLDNQVNKIDTDPRISASQDYLQGILGKNDVQNALYSQGSDQNAAAATSQANQLRSNAAQSGMSPSDPAFQALMRGTETGRMQANQSSLSDATVQGTNLKMSAANQLASQRLSQYAQENPMVSQGSSMLANKQTSAQFTPAGYQSMAQPMSFPTPGAAGAWEPPSDGASPAATDSPKPKTSDSTYQPQPDSYIDGGGTQWSQSAPPAPVGTPAWQTPASWMQDPAEMEQPDPEQPAFPSNGKTPAAQLWGPGQYKNPFDINAYASQKLGGS